METAHRVEVIRLEGGERFPLLVNNASGVPDHWACRFSHTHHRNKAVKTGDRELTAIGRLLDWAEYESIDLDARFGSGTLLSAAEVERLSDAVRIKRKAEPRLIKGVAVPRIVVGDTHKSRMTTIIKYIKWRMSHILPAIANSDHAHEARVRLNELVQSIKGLVRGSKQAQREALTDEELRFLVTVSHPDHRLNPFKKKTRHRNYALILLYVELGVREGEPLVLKGSHVQLNGNSPRIVIVPNPHDPDDHRRDAPQVKTNGRSLPASKLLAGALHTYGTIIRPMEKGAKRQPFFFLETRDGSPMSLDAVYDVFRVLRRRFPDKLPANLSTHPLRHTWNARFRAQAKLRGWSDGYRDVVNNYLMGWTKTSEQSKRYGHSQIVREAEEVLMALQVGMDELAA